MIVASLEMSDEPNFLPHSQCKKVKEQKFMNEEQKYIDFETITVRKTQESKLVVISVNKVHDVRIY